jgi:lipoprotein Spr
MYLVLNCHEQQESSDFFNTRGGVSHVGVYLGNNYFVHSSVHDGVTISSLDDNYYHSKFICGGRFTYTFTVAPDEISTEEEKQDQ